MTHLDTWCMARGKSLSGYAFKKEQQAVLDILRKHYPAFINDEKAFTVSWKDLQQLLKKIAPAKISAREAYKRRSFLLKGLKLGEAAGKWTLPNVPLQKLLRKEKNRAIPKLNEQVNKFRGIESKFIAGLESYIPETQSAKLGQICVSAMMYGGLTHKKWLKPLYYALKNHQFYLYDDWLWLDLWVDAPPTKNGDRFFLQKRFDKYRRWFADPMTQLLIFQWITKNDDTLPSSIDSDIWNACQEYLLNINVEKLSLPSFLKCCQSRNTLTIPPFLAEYAENKLPSASLPDEVWLRVLTGKNIPIRIQPKRPIEQNIGPFEFKYEKQKQLLKELISQLEEAATPLETVDDFLQKHVGDISPILFLLADWAIQLLSPRLYEYEIRNKSGSLAPSSVQNYLRTIGEDLLAEWEDKDITNLEDDKIISIIYATGRRLQGKGEDDKDLPDELANEKVYRLRQFYRHIEIFHGAPQIDIIDMLNANGEIISRPNVNLLTFEQYRQVLTNLGWEREKLSRLEKISLFFTIIAFRGGLRSSEIMGLLVGDLQGDRSLEILVRPQHERKLKSPAAKRRIPLHILLSEDELAFILSWLKFRRAEPGVTHKHLLLTEGPLINQQLEVPKQVRVCLKETINDSTFVVHHLRHCYETWLLTRLLLRTDIHLSSVPSFLRSSEFENKNLGDMRDFFFENEPLRRKSNYAAAVTIGHADILEGYHSYMHLTDWLLGYMLRHQHAAIPISNKALATITGRTIDRANQLIRNNPNPLLAAVSALSVEFKKIEPHSLLSSLQKNQNKPQKERKKGLPPFDEAFSILKNSHFQNGGIQVIPKAIAAISIVEELYENFLNLSLRSQKKNVRIAKSIKANTIQYNGSIECRSIKEAKECLDFLLICGIRKKQLQIIYHAPRGTTTEASGRINKKWTTALSIKTTIGPNTKRSSTNGCIRIEVENLGKNHIKKTEIKRILYSVYGLLIICRSRI